MALVKKDQLGISQDGKTLYVTDITGDYNALINTTGYGTPNPLRNTFALILFVTYKGTTGDTIVVVNDYVPETVTSFTVPLLRDGWYTVNSFLIPLFSELGSYTDGDITYNQTTEQVQIYDGTEWSEATEEQLLAEPSIYNSQQHHAKIAEIVVEKHLTWMKWREKKECDRKPFIEKIDYMDIQMKGALYDFCSEYRYEFQKTIEELLNYIENN